MYFIKVPVRDWDTDKFVLVPLKTCYGSYREAVVALGGFHSGAVFKQGDDYPVKMKVNGKFVGNE